MEYIIARLERGRDLAAARRHRGLPTGKSAKGWSAKPRTGAADCPYEQRAATLARWQSDRHDALAVYTRLVFPERDFDPFDPAAPDTLDAVIAAHAAADRDALLTTF